MQELSSRRRTLEKKEDALQKEYKLLVSGRVMELPDNLKEEFEKLRCSSCIWNGVAEKEWIYREKN